MILYVNGCSHTAGADGVTVGSRWCDHLALDLDAHLVCDAQVASSNARIMRTTREWLCNRKNDDVFVILQWSTWEREEWQHEEQWYQVNASGADRVPLALQQRYREFVISVDWKKKTQEAHEQIWQFHVWLQHLDIPHVFYSSWSTFDTIPESHRRDWGKNYIDAYDSKASYAGLLRQNGFDHTKFYHFGADAHRFWAKHVLKYLESTHWI